MYDFISRLEKGYDTEVEKGAAGCQRTKAADFLARAVVANPRLLF